MQDRDIYSVLIPFVENYFKGENYSIEKLTPLKAKAIKEKSMLVAEYDAKRKVVTLISTQNPEERIVINLRTKKIDGEIEYIFDCNTSINYFDNLEEYIFNSELVKNILTYTSVGVRGKIKGLNKFCIYFGTDNSTHLFDNIDAPIFSLFNNELEFSSLFNIARNTTIESEDRFVWVFNSAANLRRASKRTFNFKFIAKNLRITDQMVASIKGLDNTNIAGVDFVNCKFKLQDPSNQQFLESIAL